MPCTHCKGTLAMRDLLLKTLTSSQNGLSSCTELLQACKSDKCQHCRTNILCDFIMV